MILSRVSSLKKIGEWPEDPVRPWVISISKDRCKGPIKFHVNSIELQV